ncbi:surface antigen [Plasmodium falciparum UGT5.1]|uniref:Surface antigen n=1 Tax=Plasmodium falciparum UGT5.1 TaxID=1237627 RepID=W7JX92_PLAFA|nr:surface antigen [Plasmodium falciparum UGT5.1]
MKAVMQQFVDRTTQRFQEYDERMKTPRQKCKERCDKEIQKIILKDKIEKELAEKFATLQTDIQSDSIPTCVCEKSLADKVEKGCLRCGGVLGGGIAPGWGLLSGIVYTGWKAAALAAAKKAAMIEGAAKGAAAGIEEGIKVVMDGLVTDLGVSNEVVTEMGLVFNAKNYYDASYITQDIYIKFQMSSCLHLGPGSSPGLFSVTSHDKAFCNSMLDKLLDQGYPVKQNSIEGSIQKAVEKIVTKAKSAAASETANVTKAQTAILETRKITEF